MFEKWFYYWIQPVKTWHHLAVKEVLHGIGWKHNGDSYFMSYLHSSEQKTNFELKSHECVCKNHNYCNVKMPEAHNKIFNLIRNNNLSRFHLLSMDTQNLHSKKKLLYDNSLTKLYKYAPCAYSLFTHCSFDNKKVRQTLQRWRLYEVLYRFEETLTEIINREQKEILSLRKKRKDYTRNKNSVTYPRKNSIEVFNKDENYRKVFDSCRYIEKCRSISRIICNLIHKAPKSIYLIYVIYNSSCFGYHFITKELAEEFQGQFQCWGQNAEKNTIFMVPIKK